MPRHFRKNAKRAQDASKRFAELERGIKHPLSEPLLSQPKIPVVWLDQGAPPLQDLPRLLAMTTGQQLGSSLALKLHCPRHPGMHSMRAWMDDRQVGWFACHICGTCLSHTELVCESHQVNPETAIQWLLQHELVRPLKKRNLDYSMADRLLKAFITHRRTFEDAVLTQALAPRFGDWSLIPGMTLRPLLGRHTNLSLSPDERYLIRLSRNVLGRPAALTLHNQLSVPMLRIVLHDSRVLLDAPRWAENKDWSSEIVICEDHSDALAIQQELRSWSIERRPALALLTYLEGRPILSPAPFHHVCLIPAEASGLEFTLAFEEDKTRTTVWRYRGDPPERRDFFQKKTVWEEMDHQMPEDLNRGLPWLNRLLSYPWVRVEARRRLLASASLRYNKTPSELNDLLEPGSSPHGFRTIENLMLFCSAGAFWSKGPAKSADPARLSNFCVYLLRRTLIDDQAGWNIELCIEGRSAYLSLDQEAMSAPNKLWRFISKAAAEHGLPEPIFYDHNYMRFLPGLVKSTSLLKPEPQPSP